MSFISITALSFPAGTETEIVEGFAQRDRAVDQADGFLGFELLRPAFGEDRFFVMTRWDSQESYQKWLDARPERKHDDQRSGMSVVPMGFEVVQSEKPVLGNSSKSK